MENNTTYTVWETIHEFSDNGENDKLIPNIKFIESLPNSVKAIIAHYSTLIPDHYWEKDTRAAFVAALGGFSSLEEAQRKLLKQYKLNNLQTAFYKGVPNKLELKQTSDAIFFLHAIAVGWIP